MKKTLGSYVAILFASLAVASLQADTIELGDFCSDNYAFNMVQESNNGPNAPATNFYQDLTTIGDTLNINPVDFNTTVSGPGSDIVDSQLEMVICSKDGTSFVPMIDFAESGDYEVLGFSPGDATVTVSVNYFWEVLSGPDAGTSGNGSVTPFTASATPNTTGTWNHDFNIDFAAMGIEGTCIRFEFDNRLSALAADGATAFVAKKQIPGITITVPEPGSIGMLLIGLIAALGFRRS